MIVNRKRRVIASILKMLRTVDKMIISVISHASFCDSSGEATWELMWQGTWGKEEENKEEKSGRKGKSRKDSFTLPLLLLTDRIGCTTVRALPCDR